VRQPKKSLVRGVHISYKFRHTQESGSTSGKETLFERASDVQVVLPSDPKDHVVGHGCSFRILGNDHRYRTGSVPKLDRTTLVCGLFLPCHSLWKCLWVLSLPHKIMFHQDGTIEFISVLRRRSVLARDVVSIKPEGTAYGFLVVRTARSKIRLLAQFDGFHDFLTRLKAINPTVELRGC
jgi:hypothetical protein